MRFRPCIDLHEGRVKQIVGSSLRDGASPLTNFDSELPPAYYAELYQRDGLRGGHVIMLGPGNEAAATEALGAFPGGLQVGGGIDADNAASWIERGAAAVVATSFVFGGGRFQADNLQRLADAVGREQLVLDLSCTPVDGGQRYVVATDRWQRLTEYEIDAEGLGRLAESCCEFLVHATHVEGKQEGVDERLLALLSEASPLPTTYAGGVASMADVERIGRIGGGRLDYTVGSALDIFGGTAVRYEDLVDLDRAERSG
jgi:phosphoribosylformimino-5-aminoimidazole carboxamide ribotide isomerase